MTTDPGTPFSTLLAGLASEGGGDGAGADYAITLTPDWLQGRTAFGGLTAALCVAAALRSAPDAPPLRSAQFMLAGPASGPLTVSPRPIRRGKSSLFMAVEVTGDAGPAARALLSFGAGRDSALHHMALPAPKVSAPEECDAFFKGGGGPGFSRHFETGSAGGSRPFSPDATPELLLWVRHRDPAARDTLPGLVAIADTPPAAALVLFPAPAPFSTMTWSFDMLTGNPETRDGWWLIHSIADSASDGYATQAMTIWNSDGQAVLAARQSVAVFI